MPERSTPAAVRGRRKRKDVHKARTKLTKPSGPPPEPWERQITESSPEWEAFRTYRDMGAARSLNKVATEVKKDPSLIYRWSQGHAWVARAHYYEAYQDRENAKRQEHDRKVMIERHARASMLLQAKALEALQKIEPEMLTTTDLLRWVEVGIKLERLTRGAGTPEEAAKSAYQALWERLGGPELEANPDS